MIHLQFYTHSILVIESTMEEIIDEPKSLKENCGSVMTAGAPCFLGKMFFP